MSDLVKILARPVLFIIYHAVQHAMASVLKGRMENAGWPETARDIDSALRVDRRAAAEMQLLTADKEAFGAVHSYALARLGLVGKSVASGRHAPGPDVRVHGDDNRGMLAVRISSPGGSGTATLARVGDSSAFVCSTLDGNAFARRVLAPFIRSLYPGISSTFLGCGEIRDAVAGTGQAGIDVRDAPAGRSGRPADKVAFRITEPAKPVIDGYVSRDGTMRVRGALGPFEGAVLRLADLAEKKGVHVRRQVSPGKRRQHPAAGHMHGWKAVQGSKAVQ